mmetsp:Transcript_22321/g.48338  ORF Transcript_22321/g.48338 Transcript_22321/m.48338 type:complete len:292 (-) Transcript_22321:737-1612(-)
MLAAPSGTGSDMEGAARRGMEERSTVMIMESSSTPAAFVFAAALVPPAGPRAFPSAAGPSLPCLLRPNLIGAVVPCCATPPRPTPLPLPAAANRCLPPRGLPSACLDASRVPATVKYSSPPPPPSTASTGNARPLALGRGGPPPSPLGRTAPIRSGTAGAVLAWRMVGGASQAVQEPRDSLDDAVRELDSRDSAWTTSSLAYGDRRASMRLQTLSSSTPAAMPPATKLAESTAGSCDMRATVFSVHTAWPSTRPRAGTIGSVPCAADVACCSDSEKGWMDRRTEAAAGAPA